MPLPALLRSKFRVPGHSSCGEATTAEARAEKRCRRSALPMLRWLAMCTSLGILPVGAQVRNVSFSDSHSSAYRIAGAVSWDPPNSTDGITHYEVWQAADGQNLYGTQLWDFNGGDPRPSVPVGTNQMSVMECWRVTTQGTVPAATSLVVIPMPMQNSSTWGWTHIWDDANQAPLAPPLSHFTFSQTDPSHLGGLVTWVLADAGFDTGFISHYAIFFARDANGAGRVLHALAPTEASNYTVPDGTEKGIFRCVLLYGCSPRGFAQNPSDSFCFEAEGYDFSTTTFTSTMTMTSSSTTATSDPALVSITNVRFNDTNPTAWALSGTISWTPPAYTDNVLHYVVALAADGQNTDAAELWDAKLGPRVPVGTNVLTNLPRVWRKTVNYPNSPANFITVRAYRSDLGGLQPLQEAGVMALYDRSATALGSSAGLDAVAFQDEDPTGGHVRGTVAWSCTPGRDYGFVSHWDVYLAEDRQGTNERLIGSTTTGQHELAIETACDAEHSFVLVYARNENGRATASQGAYFWDDGRQHVPTVTITTSTTTTPDFLGCQDVTFVDASPVANKLFGSVVWTPPPDTRHISHYKVYQSSDRGNSDGSPMHDRDLGTEIPVGTNQLQLVSGHGRGTCCSLEPANWILVCAWRTDLGAYENCTSTRLYDDGGAAPSGVPAIRDLAFEEAQEGAGTVSWLPDESGRDLGFVSHYAVYVAENATGGQQQLVARVPLGATQAVLPDGTTSGLRNWLLVYASNSYGDALIPLSLEYQQKQNIPGSSSNFLASKQPTQTQTTTMTTTWLLQAVISSFDNFLGEGHSDA